MSRASGPEAIDRAAAPPAPSSARGARSRATSRPVARATEVPADQARPVLGRYVEAAPSAGYDVATRSSRLAALSTALARQQLSMIMCTSEVQDASSRMAGAQAASSASLYRYDHACSPAWAPPQAPPGSGDPNPAPVRRFSPAWAPNPGSSRRRGPHPAPVRALRSRRRSRGWAPPSVATSRPGR